MVFDERRGLATKIFDINGLIKNCNCGKGLSGSPTSNTNSGEMYGPIPGEGYVTAARFTQYQQQISAQIAANQQIFAQAAQAYVASGGTTPLPSQVAYVPPPPIQTAVTQAIATNDSVSPVTVNSVSNVSNGVSNPVSSSISTVAPLTTLPAIVPSGITDWLQGQMIPNVPNWLVVGSLALFYFKGK